jgi:hypothetical protein
MLLRANVPSEFTFDRDWGPSWIFRRTTFEFLVVLWSDWRLLGAS